MFNLEPQFNLFIKQIILSICKQNKGYLNCWPKLMEVKPIKIKIKKIKYI
jgi:hypothetical protein